MNLITPATESEINKRIIAHYNNNGINEAINGIEYTIDFFYGSIPANKRISYGIVHTIKVLSQYLFNSFTNEKPEGLKISIKIFETAQSFKSQAVALGIISFYGLEKYSVALPFFEKAATSENWDLREMAQMFFRKLIKKYPSEMQTFLIAKTNSPNPNMRRFVSETLRPVQENKWFYKNPEFSLKIIRNLFFEKSAYPRTSVGNNLSDLARHLPDLIQQIVKELVHNGDKNSYWIAYRACRNLVKNDPKKIMDLLQTKTYKYKTREYKYEDYA